MHIFHAYDHFLIPFIHYNQIFDQSYLMAEDITNAMLGAVTQIRVPHLSIV